MSRGDAGARAKLDRQIPEIEATWIIDSGTVQILRGSKESGVSNYFIRPIEEGEFEMLMDLPDGEQTYVIIRRTSFGFCYRFGGDYTQPPVPQEYAECYVPDDA